MPSSSTIISPNVPEGTSIQNQPYYFRRLTENKNKHRSRQGIKEMLEWEEHPGSQRQDREVGGGGKKGGTGEGCG